MIGIVPCPPRRGKDDTFAIVLVDCSRHQIFQRRRWSKRALVEFVLADSEKLTGAVEWVYRRHSSGTVAPRNVQYRDDLVTVKIGKGKQEPQRAICIAQTQLPTPQGQPIYSRLPVILDEHGLDHIAKERPRMGRPRVAAGIYFLRKIQQLR